MTDDATPEREAFGSGSAFAKGVCPENVQRASKPEKEKHRMSHWYTVTLTAPRADEGVQAMTVRVSADDLAEAKTKALDIIGDTHLALRQRPGNIYGGRVSPAHEVFA